MVLEVDVTLLANDDESSLTQYDNTNTEVKIDTLIRVENIKGTAYKDTIIGNEEINIFYETKGMII